LSRRAPYLGKRTSCNWFTHVQLAALTLRKRISSASPNMWPTCLLSFRLDRRRLDDRSPARNLVLDQRGKLLLTAPRLVGNFAAELEQAFLRPLVIHRLLQRLAELVENGLRRALGRKQGVPGRSLELRETGLRRGGYLRQRRAALGGADCIGFESAAVDRLHDVGGDVAHVIDLAGNQRGDGGRGAVERDQCRLDAEYGI